jgi:hypothetical protein
MELVINCRLWWCYKEIPDIIAFTGVQELSYRKREVYKTRP